MTNNANDPALDAADNPAQMYALIAEQQKEIAARQGAIVPKLTLAWGLAWLLGFGALWLIDGARPVFALPLSVAIAIFVLLTIGAIAVSTVAGIRNASGIRSSKQNAFTGAVYGSTWTLGMVAIMLFGLGLASQGMTPQLANYFYPISYVIFTGIMYVVAGAIWQAKPSVIIGVALVIVGCAASFLPYPGHYLLLALAAGGIFLIMAVVSTRWIRKTRAAAVR